MTPFARERDLARWLLAREASGRDDPDTLAMAAVRVFDRLHAHLSRWFGPDGVHALLSRALDRARPQYPSLASARAEARGQHCIEGLADSVRGLSAAQAKEMLEAFVGIMISLLSRLVGDDMAVRLVEQSWSDASRAELRANTENVTE